MRIRAKRKKKKKHKPVIWWLIWKLPGSERSGIEHRESQRWETRVLVNRVISASYTELVYIRTMHQFMQYHIFLNSILKIQY